MSKDKVPGLDRAVGTVLGNHRRSLGITQLEVSEQLGYHSTAICVIESGQRSTNLNLLHRYAKILGVTAWQIIRDAEQLLDTQHQETGTRSNT